MSPLRPRLAQISRLLLPALVLLVIGLGGGGPDANANQGYRSGASFYVERLLDSPLRQADGETSALDTDLQAAIDARLLRFDAAGRLEVQVRSSSLSDTIAAIEANGGEFGIADAERGLAQGFVPIAAIPGLIARPTTEYVSEPRYGIVNRGSVAIESYEALQLDVLRSAFAAEGRNVRIGVISDGIGGISEAQASGDLPGVDSTTCNVVPGADPQRSGAEGTALLEVVHDLAPKAELWFGNYGFGSYVYFNQAVNCLAANVDVIVDDISWFVVGPFDGNGPVSLNVTRAMRSEDNRLLAYVTSVGNFARRHWSAGFAQCGASNREAFLQGDGTIDRGNLGPRCSNPVTVGPGATLIAFLQWDDPFNGSCNNYDFLVLGHDSEELLASSRTVQDCSADPAEVISWRNDSDRTVTVDLAIERANPGAANVRFDIFLAGGTPNFYTPAGSIGNVADSPEAIAVGAVDIADPGLDDIELYSSLGPSASGIVKPEITAPDCVSITGAGNFGSPFCGTSASAPHVAAVLGLLIGCNPALLDPDDDLDMEEERGALRSALLDTAADRPPLGADNTWGHGLVDPLAAAVSYCRPPEVVVGNVNCDTRVDAIDGLYLLRHVAGLPPYALCLGAGDVNCSETMDAIDSLGVLRFAAGLPALAVPPGCPPIGVVPGTR